MRRHLEVSARGLFRHVAPAATHASAASVDLRLVTARLVDRLLASAAAVRTLHSGTTPKSLSSRSQTCSLPGSLLKSTHLPVCWRQRTSVLPQRLQCGSRSAGMSSVSVTVMVVGSYILGMVTSCSAWSRNLRPPRADRWPSQAAWQGTLIPLRRYTHRCRASRRSPHRERA